MSVDPTPRDVAIVGAGPVGLLLAGELRLREVDVVVLERLEAPTTQSRASTLHARTMELFDSRGLLERFGELPGERRGHFGGIPMDLTLPGPFPGQWKVPQTRTEAVLAEWATRLGAEVRRGRRVRGLTQHPDRVVLDTDGPAGGRRVEARYVVACDGERSTVRDLLGADFPGHVARRELLRADVLGIDVPARRFERRERGMAVAARAGGGVTRVMVHEFGVPVVERATELGPDDFDEVVRAWRRVTGEDLSGGTAVWVNGFDDTNRQLTRYRHGRVLFAGDAAHRQLPIGGQALNLGLQDAANLGWKLAARLRHHAGEAPDGDQVLDSYHVERHAVGRQVLANIRAQAMLLLGGPQVEPLRALWTELLAMEPVRVHVAGMISGLGVRYDVGPGGHPLLGARLPRIQLRGEDGRPTTTEAALRSGRGLLVDLGAGIDPEPLRPWRGLLDLVPGPAPNGPVGPVRADDPLSGARAALVRPDGYVVWVDRGGRGSELLRAVHRWFGSPSGAEGRRPGLKVTVQG